MAAEQKNKRTFINTVRDQYPALATFLNPLHSHWSLPLRQNNKRTSITSVRTSTVHTVRPYMVPFLYFLCKKLPKLPTSNKLVPQHYQQDNKNIAQIKISDTLTCRRLLQSVHFCIFCKAPDPDHVRQGPVIQNRFDPDQT